MSKPRLPDHVYELLLAEELAQGMEEALCPPSRSESEGRRMRRFDKAGTYTLAEKYKLELDGFKKR